MPFASTIRRFSRTNSQRNSQQSDRGDNRDGPHTHSYSGTPGNPPSAYNTSFGAGVNGAAISSGTSAPHYSGMYSAADHQNGRPISQDTDSSFEHMNRPISHQGPSIQVPTSSVNGLSRTDQVVLRYFWEDKYADNAKRDLHFVC